MFSAASGGGGAGCSEVFAVLGDDEVMPNVAVSYVRVEVGAI